MNGRDRKLAVEAMIISSSEPVSPSKIAQILSITEEEVDAIVDALNEEYAASRSFRIEKVSGGYKTFIIPPYGQYARAISGVAKIKLSRSTLQTLAIIAYEGPISKVRINAIKGVDSSHTIKNLLEMGLIKVVGRADGGSLVYQVTDKFFSVLGINSIDELISEKEQ